MPGDEPSHPNPPERGDDGTGDEEAPTADTGPDEASEPASPDEFTDPGGQAVPEQPAGRPEVSV
ncbi:MAG: hypothetical protein ACOCS7_02110, partial [Halolamina sp.]